MDTKELIKRYFGCYFSFFVNGMMVLMVGAVLPYMIEEARLSYSVAGGLLSAFAIGNLLASFVNPVVIGKIGRKKAVILLAAMIPIGLYFLTMLPAVPVMYVIFIAIGIGRGSVSIFNNAVINDASPGNPIALNLLHTLFAFGAFLAPFITSLYTEMGANWRAIIYTVILLLVIALLFYCRMEVPEGSKGDKKKSEQQSSYLKNIEFYIVGFILFFYLGVENCVNGWFITYFKDTNIMGDVYAANLVTIVWIMVMIGRLTTAYLAKKMESKRLILMNCLGAVVFFILLIATKNLGMITVAIIGFGFCIAGIYPTCISRAGRLIQGSTSGMSVLMAMAAIGGIVAPKIVGVIADSLGLVQAISFLAISIGCMLICSILLRVRKEK